MATEEAAVTGTTKFQNADFHPEISVDTTQDCLPFWQNMFAGSVTGIVEHIALFPVDTVKTRMQALGSCPVKSVSISYAVRSILQSEGPATFYRGIAAMGLGAGPAHAVHYSVYEACKKYFSGRNPNNPVAQALAGVCATISNDAVFTPMDTVKQRLQLGDNKYKGLWDCIKRVFREEGFRAFYASYRTTVLMNAPYMAMHFPTYEAAKRGLIQILPETSSPGLHATAGAAAGALASAVTTPLDVVKTQLQCQGVCGCDRFKSGSIRDVVQTIVQKNGYRGLMRGWIPRMLFHAPAAAISWSMYEAVKSFFKQRNGNSSAGNIT